METIKLNDSGAAVEDVQHRLSRIGLLDEACVDGLFGPETAKAVAAFRSQAQLECGEEVDEKPWIALVDASFCLGDRTLYLRMPHFHGHDVQQLQKALSALGFACVSNVESIEHAPGSQLVLRRRLEDGIASVSAQPGLVVSLCEYSYPLRLPGIMSMRRSLSKSVELITAGDIGLPPAQCGFKGSPTRTVSMQNRYPGLRRCTKETDVEKGAAELVRRIGEVRK